MGNQDRRLFLKSCVAAPAILATAQQTTSLLTQFQFESKPYPNLHHFLWVLGRARSGARDSARVAVKEAPNDIQGFDRLSNEQRKGWNDAIAIYQEHAAPLDIGYGKLVDVNYAVADLKAQQRIEDSNDIPVELKTALSTAAPVYRALWWPRHDAANLKWIGELKPKVEQYGPRIVERLTKAFQHQWPSETLRVEAVAYANPQGAYTTLDPPLITMSTLNPQHTGVYALEQLFHECSHAMMGTVDAILKARAEAEGKKLSRDVSHTILFYTVGQTVREIFPDHIPYPDHYGVWERGWSNYRDLLKLYWQPYLDGKVKMDQALAQILHDV